MKADLLLDERHVVSENSFVELVVWRLATPLSGSRHGFKYRLAFVVDGTCVLRYDNETGKGDHRHRGGKETDYRFASPRQLIEDFWQDVESWRKRYEKRHS